MIAEFVKLCTDACKKNNTKQKLNLKNPQHLYIFNISLKLCVSTLHGDVALCRCVRLSSAQKVICALHTHTLSNLKTYI